MILYRGIIAENEDRKVLITLVSNPGTVRTRLRESV